MFNKIAILGAGNAGVSLSGHLAIKGFEVRLYEIPELKDNLNKINEEGGIEITGVVEGFGKLKMATTNMSKAVKNADLILIAVPAFAHSTIMNEYLKYAEQGQTVVFLPGNYSALRFYNLLKEKGMENSINILSTASMIYACRKAEENKANIMAIKNQLPISSIPSFKTKSLLKKLKHVFEEFVPANNVLEIGLNNLNCILHTPTAILNAGRIENTQGNFDFYWEGMTKSVCLVLESVDKERLLVGKALGTNLIPIKGLLFDYYSLEGKNLHEIVTNSEVHGGSGSPDNLTHRYIEEDTIYGLVPISSIGKYLGIKTPITDSIIELASTLNGINYWQKGITIEKLGLASLTIDETLSFLRDG